MSCSFGVLRALCRGRDDSATFLLFSTRRDILYLHTVKDTILWKKRLSEKNITVGVLRVESGELFEKMDGESTEIGGERR